MRRWFTDQAAVGQPPGYRYIAQVVCKFDRRSFAAMTTELCELGTVDRLPEISVPTLVVAAPEDPGLPPEMSALLAAKIPTPQPALAVAGAASRNPGTCRQV